MHASSTLDITPSINTVVCVALLLGAIILWPSADELARARLTKVTIDSNQPTDAGGAVKLPRWVIRIGIVSLAGAALAIGIAETLALAIAARSALSVYRSIQARRQAARRLNAVSALLESIISELKTGQTPAAALDIAHRDLLRRGAAPAIATAIGQAAQTAAFGSPWPEDAIRQLPQLSRIWQISQEFGLPMAEMLDCYRGDLTAQLGHQSKTSAALAGPRLTIAILASLPIFGLAMGQAFGAQPLEFLFAEGIGAVVLVVGIGLCCAGVVWAMEIMTRAEALQ